VESRYVGSVGGTKVTWNAGGAAFIGAVEGIGGTGSIGGAGGVGLTGRYGE
jgi:hypothetical protein